MVLEPLQIETAAVFAPLLEPRRYKGAYGGRGSGKSHFFAELIVEMAYATPGFRAVCIREVQNTIKESVRQLLIDKINKNGLSNFFQVLDGEIRGANGSLIIFKGMQHYSADGIKSLEGYDVAWVEEAQTLSQRSLDLLRPTIRKEGSEIWFSWNPENEDDPVDQFFRGQARGNAVLVKANWNDNPWLPDVLRAEKDEDYLADPEKAAHIWGGQYNIVTEGAYFARLLAEAEDQGRIGDFPYDPEIPVDTAWDLGVDDYTAIWFFQRNGGKVRAIDYYEVSGEGAEWIVQEAIDAKPYKYGQHWLPHDVRVREWGGGAKRRIDVLRGLGVSPIRVGVGLGPVERINASRALMPLVSFNKAATALGIKRLRNYRRKHNRSLDTYTGPLHDENSHGADAFGEYAVNSPLVKSKPKKPDEKPDGYKRRTRQEATWKTV
ncbi:MAG: PBSX family phage terminase large subunit [Epibacterium sp.]|nr:PBSX family phage terminase large subunit [Epibacterium sp.]NQX73936.1 PBSX family phage terminase large subunit [Epibacterium sp.]